MVWNILDNESFLIKLKNMMRYKYFITILRLVKKSKKLIQIEAKLDLLLSVSYIRVLKYKFAVILWLL